MGILILFIYSLIPLSDAYAQKFDLLGRRRKETVDFQMIKNLMIIKLSVNGKGPFNFVLDTGVGLLLISDPKLIDSVSIENLRSINIRGFGDGQTLSAYITPGVDLNFGPAFAYDVPAAILKNDVFELSNYVGMPIHGLIGYEFFSSFTVRINFTSNTLALYRPRVHYVPRRSTRIPITIEDGKPYIMSDLVMTSGKKVTAKLIIDTGAGHPLSLEALDGAPFNVPDINISGNLGIGLTGPISGHIARISSLKLGKYTLKNVVAAFPDYEDVGVRIASKSRNGNMGIAVLRRFNVVFDYGRSALYLRRSPRLKTPFEHDMSGMELTSAGNNYSRVFVTRVEAGSSADDAGIVTGDEILAINFKSVSEFTPTEIDDLFHSKPDRSFIIDILPHGKKGLNEKERVILTLKRRI